MAAMTLAERLNPARYPDFDYGSLADQDVAQRTRDAVVRIRDLQKGAIVDIGRELIKVKQDLDHGQFLKWLEASFGWNRRTATNYMAVASEFGDVWENVSQMPVAVLYKLASPKTPAEVREAVRKLDPGQIITMGGLKYATSEAYKTQRRKERSTKEAKAIRAENNTRLEAEMRREQAEREAERVKAYNMADQARQMIGDRFDEFCNLMVGVNGWRFGEALEKLVEHHRKTRDLE